MVGAARDRVVERAGEVGLGLTGRGVDEVDVDVLEPDRARVGDGRDGASRRVRALEDGEHVLRGALHPERHASEAVVAQPLQRARVDRVGVGLGRHLGVVEQAELVAHRGEDAPEVAEGQQGRRPASDEHGRHR